MRKILLFMIPLMMLSSCGINSDKVPGIDLSDMDLSVSPGTDFFQYTNGGWIAKNPLKPEYARFGSFDALRENNVEKLNELFAKMSTLNPEYGTVDQKIVDLYKQGLDSVKLNADGATPLKKYIEQIYAVSSKKELASLVGELNKDGEGGFFSVGVDADLMDSNTQVLYMSQGGLGMGDRDYYIDPSNAKLRQGYEAMLAKLFKLSGIENAKDKAANAAKIEDKLAQFSWTSVENRDYTKLYNPMSTAQIVKTYKDFDFNLFFNALAIEPQETIIVMQPSFFEGLTKLVKDSPLDVLKDYVAANFITSSASYLSDDFYAAYFDFFSTQMSGVTEQKARWKRAMSVPNTILGEAVGQMYVAKYFPESYKNKVLEIVKNLQGSLGQHIEDLTWMSTQTKEYALQKLNGFTIKIGYPDKWKDYSSLMINPNLSYFENIKAASAWFTTDNLAKIGKATDKTEWAMTPQTVNAYYNPTTNEICFPAAILQPPFFNANADDAVNYGAIGVVIGHEMTHGFDDQGRLFDVNGNMNNWWTAEDEQAFKLKTQVLVDQYSAIEILPGLFANGELSLGENIADQGGLSIAWTAFQNSLGDKLPKDIDGLNYIQRFFIAYAHLWAQNITDEEKARLTKLDVHSLGVNRVNAAVRNFPLFYKAFEISENDPMYLPEDQRVMIW